jgi:hypothetical protein
VTKALVPTALAALAIGALPSVAGAQQVPTATPTPAASSTPSAIGPALFPNDPCTSLSAIVTRPTVYNSVCTVRPGHVLLETGYQNLSSNSIGNTVSYPQALLRIGTNFHHMEIDITPPSYQRISGGGATISGATDTALGLKYFIGATPRFAYGVQGQASIPTGSSGITAHGSNLFGAFNFSYMLSPFFSFSA